MELPSTPRIVFLRELIGEFMHNYPRGRRILAVDGVDGSGKTRFARDLGLVFDEAGVPSFQASMDGFHRPRDERYRLGRESAEGYYQDSFDYRTLRRALVDPFRMGGSTGFQTAAWDVQRDAPVISSWETGPADAVLLIDGVFLLRPELRGLWNWSVRLEVPWALAYERLAARDGRDPDPAAVSNRRYVAGQELYEAESDPDAWAGAVVDNGDPEHPVRVFRDSC